MQTDVRQHVVQHSRAVGVAVTLHDLLVVLFPLFWRHRFQDRQGFVPGGLERLPALPAEGAKGQAKNN